MANEEYVWLKEQILQKIQYFNGNKIDIVLGNALSKYNKGIITAEQFNELDVIVKNYIRETGIIVN